MTKNASGERHRPGPSIPSPPPVDPENDTGEGLFPPSFLTAPHVWAGHDLEAGADVGPHPVITREVERPVSEYDHPTGYCPPMPILTPLSYLQAQDAVFLGPSAGYLQLDPDHMEAVATAQAESRERQAQREAAVARNKGDDLEAVEARKAAISRTVFQPMQDRVRTALMVRRAGAGTPRDTFGIPHPHSLYRIVPYRGGVEDLERLYPKRDEAVEASAGDED